MRLEMYGEDPMTAGIQVRIAANPARESVRFAGHIAHATDAFAAMDLLVLPSLLDGQPATIMEANTSGILVNANPVGGVPALIEERREAFLISLRRPERVVALLTEWAAEPARFAALRETVACTDRAVSYLP